MRSFIRLVYWRIKDTILLPYYFMLMIKVIKLSHVKNGVIVVAPSLTLSGAPLLSKAIYQNLPKNMHNKRLFMSMYGGDMKGGGLNLLGMKSEFFRKILIKLLILKGYRQFILNSIVSSVLAPLVDRLGGVCVSLVHEGPSVITVFNLESKLKEIVDASKSVVFSSHFTYKNFGNEKLREQMADKVVFRKQGIYAKEVITQWANKAQVRKTTRACFDIMAEEFVVLGIGNDLNRKGFDIFSEVAKRTPGATFIWVGKGEGICNAENVRLIDPIDPAKSFSLFYAFDLFFLSSREDPFPSVVLEAMASNMPVLSIDGAGGADEIVCYPYGMRMQYGDYDSAVSFISSVIKDKVVVRSSREFVLKNFCISSYSSFLVRVMND